MTDQAPNLPSDTSAKKGRGRPKGSKNKKSEQKIVETKFGTVIQNMPPQQRKALDNLLFNGSAPSVSGHLPNSIFQATDTDVNKGRQIPQNNVKRDHLLIREINLSKNTATGNWEVASINTNHGKFETGEDQTKKINQAIVRAFVTYLRQHVFEDDLKTFLEQERV